MHTYFTACYAFLVKLVVQEKNFAPHVTFTDYCAMLSCLALNLYTYTRLIKKFNIFVMNNRNNMVPVCVRGLGLVTSCLCVKRLFEISIVSCRVCSITVIGWKRFASLNDKILSFQNKGKSVSSFHTVKSYSPTLDVTNLLAEKSKLRSKHHGNFVEKSGLWRIKKLKINYH